MKMIVSGDINGVTCNFLTETLILCVLANFGNNLKNTTPKLTDSIKELLVLQCGQQSCRNMELKEPDLDLVPYENIVYWTFC